MPLPVAESMPLPCSRPREHHRMAKLTFGILIPERVSRSTLPVASRQTCPDRQELRPGVASRPGAGGDAGACRSVPHLICTHRPGCVPGPVLSGGQAPATPFHPDLSPFSSVPEGRICAAPRETCVWTAWAPCPRRQALRPGSHWHAAGGGSCSRVGPCRL